MGEKKVGSIKVSGPGVGVKKADTSKDSGDNSSLTVFRGPEYKNDDSVPQDQVQRELEQLAEDVENGKLQKSVGANSVSGNASSSRSKASAKDNA